MRFNRTPEPRPSGSVFAQDARSRSRLGRLACFTLLVLGSSAWADEPLPGTKLLTGNDDLSALMLDGMEKYLLREAQASVAGRAKFWKRDLSSREAYEASVEPNRERLRKMIGAVDRVVVPRELEYVGGTATSSRVAATKSFTARAVRWPVFEGVEGEGLLLEPTGGPRACVIALPDADQPPEVIAGLAPGLPPEKQWARRLAEAGCQVVVPVLIDRRDDWSGDPKVWMTNCPHREWVYRAGFDLGRHIIGYEVQKVRALVNWMQRTSGTTAIGIAGYGEGGLIALYSAALAPRINAALVSGHFTQRDRPWTEPIYRNVWGLMREFGDAEIASLVAPRPLLIESSPFPRVDGPPTTQGRMPYAAPGKLVTPARIEVRDEVHRCLALFEVGRPIHPDIERLIRAPETPAPGEDGLVALLEALGVAGRHFPPPSEPPTREEAPFDPRPRQKRQFQQLVEHTQTLLRNSDETRREFWSKAKTSSLAEWEKSCAWYRDYLADEVIGRIPDKRLPINPRTRKILDKEKWTGYEVVLDVLPDVFLWGYLLVPKNMRSIERRPVVVCQHGLEGLPDDVINENVDTQAYATYKAFAARLAERGFVVFAPHHYYRGGNRFRELQRIAYPLKKTLFAFVVAQHEQLHDWLATLPFVDPQRVGFYGLSYGGFSAMRLPALVTRYALSINSAEFNDMAMKKASVHHRYSYPFYNTYEVFEWNLANTFNYSDLAGLIAPRPFMVERGHKDGVAPDEWVAAEYAKVRRRYVQLGIGDRTQIEWFDGPHTINGVGTFAFLHKHLKWPEPKK